MLRTRVMPCLLLRKLGLVKTVKFKNARFVGDPINTVRIFNEKYVDEIIVLDIFATPDGTKPQFELINNIASECFMPLTYGGGITTVEQMKQIFSLGVEKIVMNTVLFENPSILADAARIFGSQSIVCSVDVKKNLFGTPKVMTRSGTKRVEESPVEVAQRMEQLGAGELLLNNIDRDGTFKGFDTALIREVSDSVNIPVIASGGAGCVDDIAQAAKQGRASGVALGSMVVYQGPKKGVLTNFPKKNDLKIALA